jgi:hypothetical protein
LEERVYVIAAAAILLFFFLVVTGRDGQPHNSSLATPLLARRGS